MNGGSDNSAAQWAAIGMQAADDVFDIPSPDFRSIGEPRVAAVRFNGVGFGYQIPGTSVNTTPSGLVQAAWAGVRTDDPMWMAVEDELAAHWPQQRNSIYGMYALTKALRLATPSPVTHLTATGLDRYRGPNGIVDLLLTEQNDSDFPGSWRVGIRGERSLQTAWAIVMLTPTLFQLAPVADAGDPVIWGYDAPLRFDASRSTHLDPFRSLVLYEWDFDGDGQYDFATNDPNDPLATFTYVDPTPASEGDAPQVFTARLRVTDDNVPPATDVATREVTVAEPPHAPFAVPGGPYQSRCRGAPRTGWLRVLRH